MRREGSGRRREVRGEGSGEGRRKEGKRWTCARAMKH